MLNRLFLVVLQLLLISCTFETVSCFSAVLRTTTTTTATTTGKSNQYQHALQKKEPWSIKTVGISTQLAAGPDVEEDSTQSINKRKSLEEKMASWEASEEELKAASLGGLTPGKRGTDGFDIGLYIAFPIIVVTSLLFAVFPFIMDKIDVSSVGPPPTV